MSIEMTPEVIGLTLCLVFWLGRMTKTRRTVTEHKERERIVEKKIEVPTVVYKCQHDCVFNKAKSLFNEVASPDFDYSDSDEYIEQHKARQEIMEGCVKLANDIHLTKGA